MKHHRYCLALDLKNDEALISAYLKHHQNVWPEIELSLKSSGITALDIYRVENRLFMIIETNEAFSWEKKEQADQNNPKVQQWEELMWTFQQALPNSKEGEKWRMMEKIYTLS